MSTVRNKHLLVLCEGAIMVAAAFGLSFLKIPIGVAFGAFGGSIDLVMIPLIIYALRRGTVPGLIAGLVFGTLKYFAAGGVAINWQSMLLDYSIAYMAVGLAGLFFKKKVTAGWWALGALIGCLARFGIHFISGITIYAQYMPETFLDLTMTNAWFYSLLYNGTYMLPNTILAVILCGLLALPLRRVAK